MKKRVSTIIITVVFAGIIILGCLYAIDMNRMKNNESVIFSTWGYDYASSVDIFEPPVMNLLNSSDDMFVSCLTSTYDWTQGNGCVFSDYPHPANREYGENNALRISQGTEMFIDRSDFKITDINLYRINVTDKIKYHIEHTDNSICVDMPDGEEYVMEIIAEHKQGKVSYCVKVVETN